MQTYELEIEKEFNVSAQKVYDSWLDPEAIKIFMKPAPIVSLPEPQVNAIVGGKFHFDMVVGDKVLPHYGEYKVLERPSKIQFTWNSPNTGGKETLVTLFIQATSDSTCRMKLVHELFSSQEAREDHLGGWTNILKSLIDYSELV